MNLDKQTKEDLVGLIKQRERKIRELEEYLMVKDETILTSEKKLQRALGYIDRINESEQDGDDRGPQLHTI